jgi:glutathione synthase/RimK-type ligase-like ATP-grasp enzyme
MKKILVFFSYRKHKTDYYKLLFDPMAERADDFGMEFYQGSLKDLQIYFKNDSMRIVESMTGMDLREFDLVYFELFHKAQQQALAAAKYLERHGIEYFTPEVSRFTPLSKLGQQALLADQNLPLPDGITTSAWQFKKLFRKNAPLAFPFVLKSIQAFGGNNNFLIHSYAELVAILDKHKTDTFIAQPFIPNDFDYRVLILGGEIKLVIKRARQNDTTHLNNTSQDADADFFEADVLTEAQKNDSIRAATIVGREQFCGLDLLINKETGEHVVLEVNEAPAIQLGAAPERKMLAMLEFMSMKAHGVKA